MIANLYTKTRVIVAVYTYTGCAVAELPHIGIKITTSLTDDHFRNLLFPLQLVEIANLSKQNLLEQLLQDGLGQKY